MKTSFISIALAIASVAPALALTNARTVPNYDAATNTNIVDVKIPSAAYYASFVPSVASAWNVNLGGVINFDQLQTAPWPSLGENLVRARYGAAYTQTFSLGIPTIGHIGPNGPFNPISAKGNLLSQTAGAMSLSFASTTGPVRRAGFTVLQHPQISQKVTAVFIQSGGPAITYTFLIPAGLSTRDTFVGADATVPGGIVAVRILDNDAVTGAPIRVCIDDLGFVTKPLPIIVNPGPVRPVLANPEFKPDAAVRTKG